MTVYSKTFTADGDSEVIVVKKGTFYIGTTGGTNFGGGTLTIEASVDSGHSYTTVDSFTAEETATHEFEKGAMVKLTLSGATSPSLETRVAY